MITPSIDGQNMCSAHEWDWLARKVTAIPPPAWLTHLEAFGLRAAHTHATPSRITPVNPE